VDGKQAYDIIVIGGGGAGLAAAIEAAQSDARVLIVDADSKLGGTTARSTGVYYAAGTSVQRAAGIEDDARRMYDYYMTLNQYNAEPSIVRVLCDGAEPGFNWLAALGVKFDPKDLYQSGVDGVARGHKPVEGGSGIVRKLRGALDGRDNVAIMLHTRVERLIVENGAVTGIATGGRTIRARTVIVTTGGLGQSKAMWGRYYPKATALGDWVWAMATQHCRGDGLNLCAAAGAAIQGWNAGHLMMTANFDHRIEVGRCNWAVCVNREGRRFADEAMSSYVFSNVVGKQTGGSCFAVFDEAARLAAKRPPGTAHVSGLYADNWCDTAIAKHADAGKIVREDSIEELANAIGIFNPAALANTLSQFNRDVEMGHDSRFFKNPSLLRSVSTPPFYAVEMKPAIIGMTFAGPRVDKAARVIGEDEKPIGGLYAAGECVGNVIGEQYVGGGISITNAIVFGRIAGAEAARYARGVPREGASA